MLYKTTCAIILKGDRVPRGVEVELTDEEAVNLGTNVVPATSAVEVEEVLPEVPVADMSHDELKSKAKALGLKATGSKADLLERIQLHLDGKEDETN